MVEEAEIRRIMVGEKPKARERAFELPYRTALMFLFELAMESAMRMREMYTPEIRQFDIDRRTATLERTQALQQARGSAYDNRDRSIRSLRRGSERAGPRNRRFHI